MFGGKREKEKREEKEPERRGESAGSEEAAEPEKAPGAASVKLLENPLPLPKKKSTHKLMDFDYEVSDGDDFDI